MADYLLGTMGFSYSIWKGVFYPSGVPARDYLPYYARIFNTVEMDTTFYAIPRPAVVKGWSAAVPPTFCFTVKTPQSITHEMGLVNTNEFMNEFINVISLLGDKLGVILIQLPPKYANNNLGVLQKFITGLPREMHYAIEFRHRSWYTQATADLLAPLGIGWVATEFADLPHNITLTANFMYIRWLGKHAAFQRYDHVQLDRGPRLAWWRDQINQNVQQVEKVYGFFNNDYAGFAPASCNLIKSLLGLPVVNFTQPEQGRLF
jgi:uncharacterized protein YecE (DUF72 family)